MAQERVTSDGHYEMLWDCDHCDTKGLLGLSQRFCPECGAPQNPVTRYFPKEGEQRRVDGHQYTGADRTCPHCSSPMGAKVKSCTHCGGPMDGSAREVAAVASPDPRPAPKKRRWWMPVLIVSIIALAIFGIWYRFIRTRSAEMAVSAHRWSREIAVEEFKDLHQEGWRDAVPSDASFPSCYRKQRSSRQVDTGQEDCHTERRDKKDGTFEQVKKCKPIYRSEEVDDDWCSYTVRRWTKIDAARTSGTGMAPAWPATANLPAADARPMLGARRSGARTETLTLDFGPDHSCDVPDSVWRKYADGQKAKVEIRASSGDVVCDSL